MKKILMVLLTIFIGFGILAQTPEKISYQAVVRNSSNQLVINREIGVKVSILQGSSSGTSVYVENQNRTSNANGLLTLDIGNGTVQSGTFANINWANGPYFVKIEMDINGGINYSISGTSQLLSVPYALYSKKAENGFSGNYADLVNKPVLFDGTWNSLTGKPALFSGSYNDLTNKPANIVNLPVAPVSGDILFYNGTHWEALPKGQNYQVLTMFGNKPVWKEFSTVMYKLEPLHDPVLALEFDDNPSNHNMHITSDGNYFYSCNGGNYADGKINKFTLSGNFVASYPIAIDMRSIMYNKADGYLYVCGFENVLYERNIYKITNLAAGTFVKKFSNIYDNGQSGTAISYDGEYFYAQNTGTVKKYKLLDGSLVQALTGFETDNSTLAVDPDYIYTWKSSTRTVYVYNHSGGFIKSFVLPNGNYPFSLSFVDGLLFVAKDGNYTVGKWYGYNIRKVTTKSATVTSNAFEMPSSEISGSVDTAK
jgi:hypothetical protein